MEIDFWEVYVLKCSDNTYYVGCSSQLNTRLAQHSKGEVSYTKTRLPVQVVTSIRFIDKTKAFQFEKYLKSGSGKAFMNKRLV
ncbi:GIY-YIG nuclease family protein [Halocola ammonii]